MSMSSPPLVSVIVPVYNGAATLGQAVRSALDQTLPDVEVIVVDDASTDRTPEVLAAFSDPRIVSIRHEVNAGEGAARNTAAARASGRWLAMLDADDAWEPERLERLLEAGRGIDGPVIIADNIMHCYTVAGALKPWKRQWGRRRVKFYDGRVLLDLAGYLKLEPLLVKPLVPRDLVARTGIVHSRRIFSADTEFMVRILKTGARLLVIDEPLYLYRRAWGSMSDNPDRAAIMRAMFADLLQELEFSEAETAALRRRVERLQREEIYLPFLAQLKKFSPGRALAMCLRHPWLIAEFARRVPASMAYRMHLWTHRGRAR